MQQENQENGMLKALFIQQIGIEPYFWQAILPGAVRVRKMLNSALEKLTRTYFGNLVLERCI